ncbi:DUF2525 domain-containing protein [Shigella flexneri]|nr:DUF2525 domain-containing protein [Shigella flexneri]HCR6486378.1 DUF2525 domain-containing protein [Shigella flexneri]
MKTAKVYSDTAKREVSVDGREYHTWRELADAFELDIHDFSVSEVNR